jgi:protein-L-isoaspartate(D-aspartate) O-methyltransferase
MDKLTDTDRLQMVNQQIRTGDVLNPAVLKVLTEVPRERFVGTAYRSVAFADTNIPLAHGRHMMTPLIEGRVLQALEIKSHDQVLVVGTGSGFLTACLARLARHVTSIDTDRELVDSAREALADIGIHNVDLATDDPFRRGDADSFDAIAVTGSTPEYDPRFQHWLKLGGRLFIVVGQAPLMEACLVRRTGIDEWARESLFETVLPSLTTAVQPAEFKF